MDELTLEAYQHATAFDGTWQDEVHLVFSEREKSRYRTTTAERARISAGFCRAAACSATAMRWCVRKPDYPGSRRQRDADRGKHRRSAAAAARCLSPG
jgi:hypothetical protein